MHKASHGRPCPTKDNRVQALKDFHRRAVAFNRLGRTQGPDSPSTDGREDQLRKELRARPRGKVHHPHGGHVQPNQVPVVAGPVGSGQMFREATDAVKLEFQRINGSQVQCAASMDEAFITYQPSLRERSQPQPAPAERAQEAWKYLGSIGNGMAAIAKHDRPKQRSSAQWMFDALTEGIQLAKTQCTVEAEKVALNGAGAANMLANLVQSPAQIMTIAERIDDLRREVVQLKRLGKAHDAVRLHEAQRELRLAIQEARKIARDMQSKVQALEKVATHAEHILSRAARDKKRKAIERASVMNAMGLCGGLRLALRNLNGAYADKDSVYARFGVALNRLEAELPTD